MLHNKDEYIDEKLFRDYQNANSESKQLIDELFFRMCGKPLKEFSALKRRRLGAPRGYTKLRKRVLPTIF
jgi:hypothetical protein